MPAPRPASGSATRSYTETSSPRLFSASAASRPLIDPPITSARTSAPGFSANAETCYSLVISMEERHGDVHEGEGFGEPREDRMARGAKNRVRARSREAERLRRFRASLRDQQAARMDDPTQTRRAHRLPSPRAELFLDLSEWRTRASAFNGRHHGRIHLPSGRDAARRIRARRVQGARSGKPRRPGHDLHDGRIHRWIRQQATADTGYGAAAGGVAANLRSSPRKPGAGSLPLDSRLRGNERQLFLSLAP